MKKTQTELKKELVSILDGQVKSALEILINNSSVREKFLRVFRTAVFKNPDLLNAHRESLINACLKCAEWEMMPDNNEAALIPFNGIVNAIPMVGGFLRRLSSEVEFEKIYADVIYYNDEFTYTIDSDTEHLRHSPVIHTDGGEMVGAYAGIIYKKNSKEGIQRRKFEIARKHEVENVLKINKGRKGHSKAWDFYPEEMIKKYMIKRMAKRTLCLQVQDELLANEEFDQRKTSPASVINPALITRDKNEKEQVQ